ncbi:MAG: hypothetical protein OXI38_14725 [Bacteroidota bacterium]|nr:hypothetical protein [Bacteroidota bacterium]
MVLAEGWTQWTLLLAIGISAVAEVSAQDESAAELKYFKSVRTIVFDDPDVPPIAAIDHMDVDASGRLLVTDELGEQVLLFDSKGILLASLDPRGCHPGFTFLPVGAMFGGDEYIFLRNAGPWGYLFTSEGACMEDVDPEFVPSTFMDIDPTGTLFGVQEKPFWEVRRMSPSGKLQETFPVMEPRYPNASSRYADGGVVADGTHIYFAWAPEPTVLKYTLAGEFVRKIQKRSRYFKPPDADLPAELSPELFAALRRWTGTITLSVLELDDHIIMVQYLDYQRGTGYQVFSKDGTLIAEELGIGGRFFIHGRDGFAYGIIQPDLDEKGELPNPYLIVYKFSPP